MKEKAKKAAGEVVKRTPEKVIKGLARKGLLAGIGRKAIQNSYRRGLSVTVLENNNIYRVFPDGTKKLVKRIQLHTHKYTTGKLFIK
jgi:hypothetical protein